MQQNASNGKQKLVVFAVMNNMGLAPTQQSKDNQNVDVVVAMLQIHKLQK